MLFVFFLAILCCYPGFKGLWAEISGNFSAHHEHKKNDEKKDKSKKTAHCDGKEHPAKPDGKPEKDICDGSFGSLVFLKGDFLQSRILFYALDNVHLADFSRVIHPLGLRIIEKETSFIAMNIQVSKVRPHLLNQIFLN